MLIIIPWDKTGYIFRPMQPSAGCAFLNILGGYLLT